MARRQAWSAANRFAALPAGPARDAEIAAVDHASAGVAHVVEHPGAIASTVLAVVRVRERTPVADVIRLLAAVRPA